MKSVQGRIVSVGTALPETVRDNNYFAGYLDTSDEWISRRTGIKERRIWEDAPADACAQLGAQAGAEAIKNAQISPARIDTVLCATFTPDNFFPSTAAAIGHRLNLHSPFAMDISAACSGFIYGLTTAASLVESGQSSGVLLIGSEIISRSLDFNDRGTCILFGDGAGAVVVLPDTEGRGVLASYNYTDGSLGEVLKLPAWDKSQILTMEGKPVYRQAINLMPRMVQEALQKTPYTTDDIDLLIPHQANQRIIVKVGEKLGIPPERVVSNVARYGNTSSATIPIALAEAWAEGRVSKDSLIAFTALGGGVTAGASIVRM
ncbi:MAG: beta-ketoacyl-ACP synthase III [Fibrobacterota bacterium]